MAVVGLSRYFRLWKHIANMREYVFHKQARHKRDLVFITKPLPIRFCVPRSLYLIFKEIFMSDVYEADKLVSSLPGNPVIVDIGANVGFFAIQLLSKVHKATIYAYEPVPANVAHFRHTLEQNPRISQSVRLFPMAVTGVPKQDLELFVEAEEKSQVVASVFSTFHENNTQKITVPCITLTDILQQNNLETVDLLKLDCEGSEYDIIYHTDPDLIRRFKKMVIEVHNLDTDRYNIGFFTAYIQSLGYTTTHTPINSFCYALEATRV